uniref:Uncharacterized protein n=1 Tax=Oryza meridionalis TaxID=40149 RepID=A0A0E0D339_9ORYZ
MVPPMRTFHMQVPPVNGREGLCGSYDPAKWFLRCVQKMEARSSFQGTHRVPQVNMPIFPTGMNDQWHRASTYNTSSYIIDAPAVGMYQMSINENAQPQGPSFLEMLRQGDWLFIMYSAIQMMGYAGNTQSYGEPCSYGGGLSIAQHEIEPSQIDEPPPITKPTQAYRHVDFNGVEVARRSVRE